MPLARDLAELSVVRHLPRPDCPYIGITCPIDIASDTVVLVSTGQAQLLHELIDDAGLFPPARLPMPAAIEAHLHNRDGAHGPLVGRFLVPASRFSELEAELAVQLGDGRAVRVGLINDLPVDELMARFAHLRGDRYRIELFEVAAPTSSLLDLQTLAGELHVPGRSGEVFIELPRTEGWDSDLEVKLAAIKAFGHGAKLRTGGVVPEAFPSEVEVATFIRAAIAVATPFKLTAGLHNALRHTDPETGFEHHGFLNIALAVADPGDAERWLGERDGAVVADAVRAIDPARVRSLWRAYGSCSIDEPAADLIQLGLLDV